MFHEASQVAQFLLTPTGCLAFLLALGLLVDGRGRRGGGLAALAGAALCMVALLPIGGFMMQALEQRFPPLDDPPRRVTGILVLGGAVSLRPVGGTLRAQPSDASDRLFVAADLARKAPSAKVVVIGGPIDPQTGVAEADLVSDYLQRLGVAKSRIILERRSADTFENARAAAALMHPTAKDRWLLVTSAFHMPRAVGCFRKAGFEVTAAPADWRATRRWSDLSWSATGNLRAFDMAVREMVGLAVYYQRGRTDELFPHA